ncbi:hypothetical protein [Bradyrhizobium sp. Mp27]|uniref:alpha-2-macroglobulin family protein n=1 Tax=Bradyrhizobium sp. Mp27 TaxID=3042157 RepID=UPI00248C609A|nr:hypothetical protein [Bradyrhizobium sp. Mp27]MDI2077107.1 hypothetical protein [Bradyrhizobium sp. Mp27]
MFRIVAIVACLILTTSAHAAPDIPEIIQRADAYRQSLQALRVASSATQLLQAIKRSKLSNNSPELVRLAEQLVALNPENFTSWLQLGNAQRALDPKSDKALSAAYEAYSVTRLIPEQIEALLLASSVLRSQLSEQTDLYRTIRDNFEAIGRKLRTLDEAKQSGEVTGLDKTSPTSDWKILAEAKESASNAGDLAARNIGELSKALDSIYTEISTKLPGSNVAKMKSEDARSSAFDIVPNSAGSPEEVSFRTQEGLVQACLDFTQELKANGLSYRNTVSLWNKPHRQDGDDKIAVTDFGLEARGRTLCITSLKPGEDYTIELSSKLESKSGATLAADVSLDVTTPDLPKQVSFAGRNFLLPQSGDGNVPLRITNVPQFHLEVYRVTDRALNRHVALGHIGGVLPKREYDDLRDRFGERLWSATIRVADDEKKRNKSFRAYLPVRAILNARQLDIAEKIKVRGVHQGPIASWPQQNQVLDTDDKRDVSTNDAKFEADVASFEASPGRTLGGVYALIVRDLNETSQMDKEGDCGARNCTSYLAQWFVDSDIGLAFYEGDNDFTVVARSLKTGEAKRDSRIELVSAGNRVLAQQPTNSDGVAKFSKSITQGTQSNKLIAVLAEAENDFSVLTYGSDRLDLSRLNVDGRAKPSGFNAFVTTDRGIYQGNEVIHVLAMIRDADGKIPEALPRITLRLESRDRPLDVRRVEPEQLTLGGADISLNVPAAARAGVARITASLGDAEDAAIIGEARIQIGQIRPDRASLEFVDSNWTVRKSAVDMVDLSGTAKARYLFGDEKFKTGIASNLKAEVLVKLEATESPQRNCYESFSFGLVESKLATVSSRQFFATTDENGELKLDLLRVQIPSDTKPVAAVVEVTLLDASGPVASRSTTVSLLDDNGWIGLSKIPQLRSTEDGRWKLSADLVLATSASKGVQKRSLGFKMQRESEVYVWEQRDGTWQHVKAVQRDDVQAFDLSVEMRMGNSPCSTPTRVADLGNALISGRYVLTVTDRQTNRQTSVRFQTGSALTDPEQLEPNIFSLSVDKLSYRPDDTIEVTASVPFDGPVLAAIADSDIRLWVTGNVKNGTATIRMRADRSWAGKQFYILATAYRSTRESDRGIGPARAIGIANFSVEGSQANYAVSIHPLANATFDTIQPRASLSFDVCISDESGGKCSENPPEEAFAVVYIVDEGLLGLTSHHNPLPRPETHFFGRKRLGIRLMDNYDRLLLKEGGDRPTRLALSNYTSAKVFAADCGKPRDTVTEPLTLHRGKARCIIEQVDLESGAVSIYAAVWSYNYAAAAKRRITVRSHVVADLGTPPFIARGDSALLPLRLENIDFAHQGDYLVRVDASGAKRIAFTSAAVQTSQNPLQSQILLQLSEGKPKTAYLQMDTTADGTDDIKLTVSLEAVGSADPLDQKPREWNVKIRAPALSSIETVTFPLQRQLASLGEKLKSVVAKYDPATVKVSARFSDDPQLLLSSAWTAALQEPALPVLDQLVSRAMLLLSKPTAKESKRDLTKLVNEIQSLQLPNGSFVPYRSVGNHSESELNVAAPDPDDPDAKRQAMVFRTASVLDLLSLASTAGIEVSGRTMTSASKFLKDAMDTWAGSPKGQTCSFDTAYAARVLVAVGMAERNHVEPLSKCTEAEAESDALPAKAASAAAFQKFGLPQEAKITLASFATERDPQRFKNLSDFRRAMMLVFLREANAPSDLIQTVAQSLLVANARTDFSPAAAAWIVRSRSLSGSTSNAGLSSSDFLLNGLTQKALRQPQTGLFETDVISYQSLQSSPISVGLKANRPVIAYVTVEGILSKPDESRRAPDGSLRRRFFDPRSGEELSITTAPLQVGSRLVVVVEGTKDAVPSVLSSDGEVISDGDGPLLVADLLPANFEIVSSNFPLAGKTTDANSPLDALTARGDLRTVYTDAGRWVGLVVPESQRGTSVPDQSSASPESTGQTLAAAEDPAEFRRAYVVRVNLAGRFTLPSISVERSVPPIKTLMSERSSFQVKLSEGTPK